MTSLFPILILLALGFLLWMRDEMKHAPTKKDESFPLPKPEDGSRVSEEVNESCGISLPPGVSLPDKDYMKDEEFCKKYPCDYMSPHHLPRGTLTYICTNEAAWKRWGILEEVLREFNEGKKPLCARCAGLPCKGQRKGEKR